MTTSDRTRSLLYYGVALGGYALLGVALVLSTVLVVRAGGDRPSAHPEHVAWIAETLEAAAAERRGEVPRTMGLFVDRYLEDARVLVCPSVEPRFDEDYWPDDEATAVGRGERGWSYCYVMGLSERGRHDQVAAFDEEWNHALGRKRQGVNVLHTGGHVEWRGDLDRLQREAVVQLMEMHGKTRGGRPGVAIHRPWWSRYPEPPAFEVPPPEKGGKGLLAGGSRVSLVVGAGAALVGAFLLRRVAR